MARLLFVVGARPNFVKAAPVWKAVAKSEKLEGILVHTGQHYDAGLSDYFFRDLELPEPDLHLEVGSGTHAQQTAEVMRRIEPVLESESPDGVVVFGDVNSTVAASLTAAKLGIPIAHVEAGLRSFDNAMPEEINRKVTDRLTDLFFTTETSANENLAREGVAPESIHFVGNTMVDSLFASIGAARRLRKSLERRLGLTGDYGILTLHRPRNVDRGETLEALLLAVQDISPPIPIVFPVHPRTRERLNRLSDLPTGGNLLPVEPMAYLEFLSLLDRARLVLTDSGGIQEETTALGVPCLTLRENTERPVTLSHGTNQLVGTDPKAILASACRILAEPGVAVANPPEHWDGHAAERIVHVLDSVFSS